jgi:hypothetical protein
MKKAGTYVGLNLSDQSIKRLKEFQKSLGITESFPFHITLVFSRKVIKMDLNKHINKIIHADSFHIFDNKATGGDRALVIKFKCDYCEKRWAYAKTLGATWDYPSYESHITLSYNWNGPAPDNKLLKDCKINIVSEYMEVLDLDWKAGNVKKLKNTKEERAAETARVQKQKDSLKERLKNIPSLKARTGIKK